MTPSSTTSPDQPHTTPFGEWTSPVSANDLAAGTPLYEQVLVVGDRVLWTRSDPDTGALRLHRHEPDGASGVVAPEHNVRSRVHEYGGGAVAAGDGVVLVVEFTDQRLYVVDESGATRALTPDTGSRVRFADGVVTPGGDLVAVRESHLDDGVVNELVLVDLADGSQSVLVDDHDFVSAPRLGPDGRVAWLAWNHPDMPWDGAAAWVGRLVEGGLTDVRRVVGGDGVAVADLAWRDDGALVATSDETGFWEVSVHDDGTTTRLTDGGVDLGKPRWNLGHDMLAVVGDLVVVSATEDAVDVLRVVGPDGAVRDLPGPAVLHASVVAHGDGVVTLEADPDGRWAVRRHGLDGSIETLDEVPPITDRPGDVARAVPITVPVGDDGASTHAFFHPPANADHVGPDGEVPPLVVFTHGGPTSHVSAVRSAAIAWWTTRGIAVADVNYRGSSGFGRDYRRALWGNWGETDVQDVVAVATDLADRGWVDGRRMAIRGGSAGGFTTLAVLTSRAHPFACGCSFFGVADLAALVAETHKFESRYVDRMVGPLPEARDLVEARSPLTHVDDLSVPMLVLQGLDDEVVPPRQSEVIVEAAERLGIPHAYLTFEGEGHGFRRPDSIIAWHEAELAFYGEVMGFDPAGDLPRVLG